jgi:hypothetical protein
MQAPITVSPWSRARLAGLACWVAAASGCGGSVPGLDLAEVQGTVTLDGKPVKAQLIFTPQGASAGGPSYGLSDESGRYELSYNDNAKGAVVGKHSVSITTKGFFLEWGPAGEEVRSKELLPPRYNKKTELTADVKLDGGPYDFALTSDAKK